ncbi:LysR family transcriptional regulator [Streptosporangium carneum]|uniref:LysR family transcriptional regulator n=1 Tax=Streptosporangium carneum TaxID=47481 RepID=A0A9W6MBT7_9ACTN|nr:LysR family transcriptional regulator [Streptosporangium carneum]GLK08023.1 LysR family transcriptional regulator [Streptosporangium carneum]
MAGLEIRELECFLVLTEELHFGRTAERLYLSQGRVSQLLGSLERRIGARLLERTSRRVRLTPSGERFLADLRPAYDGLREAVEQARAAARGVEGVVRVGFTGIAGEELMRLVEVFQNRHPGCEVELAESALADPFGGVRRGEVDAAVVLTPVEEPDLVVGSIFSKEPQTLMVSVRNPLAGRESISAEELGGCRLVGVAGPAPDYWRLAQAPAFTPGGLPVPRGPIVSTLQEGLTAVAADRGSMLLCAQTAWRHGRRDITFVPVTGLPDSALALVWHRDNETARVRALNHVIVTEHA